MVIHRSELALQVLTTQLAAKQNGYADVLYLDAKTDTYLEEVSSCNIFIVKDGHIKTPGLSVSSSCNFSCCSLFLPACRLACCRCQSMLQVWWAVTSDIVAVLAKHAAHTDLVGLLRTPCSGR